MVRSIARMSSVKQQFFVYIFYLSSKGSYPTKISIMSRGTNRLIREGAVPLISVESILEELGLETAQDPEKDSLPPLGKDEEIIYRTLRQTGAAGADELCALTGKPPGELAGLLSVMEIKGLVLRSGGKIMIAK